MRIIELYELTKHRIGLNPDGRRPQTQVSGQGIGSFLSKDETPPDRIEVADLGVDTKPFMHVVATHSFLVSFIAAKLIECSAAACMHRRSVTASSHTSPRRYLGCGVPTSRGGTGRARNPWR